MAYSASVVEVMIASPGDVQDERKIVYDILLNWNIVNTPSRRVVLHPIRWETHAAPDLAGRPQGLINERLLSYCDLLVAVFWTRLGSPTGIHESGTVEEIKNHVGSGKTAMVYFSNRPVVPGSYQQDQFDKVLDFKRWCQQAGIVREFENVIDFERNFARDLEIILRDSPSLRSIAHQSGTPDTQSSAGAERRTPELSPEARQLLKGATVADGHILMLRMMNGTYFKAGAEEIKHDGSRRSISRLEAAVEELEDAGLIKDEGHKREVFTVTDAGFRLADEVLNAASVGCASAHHSPDPASPPS